MSLIGVVDCNNFFVSCERLFRPDLQSKPVAVLSSNDGCIVARSQEVKDMGIPMGVPYFKVKDIVKDNTITVFSSHFALYRDISRRVFLVLKNILSEVEQYSVDEAFFVVPDDVDPVALASRIKKDIETNIGIPVSVGIAASKTQAKYAVELAKKASGVTFLSENCWNSESFSISLSKLWGVGGQTYKRLKSAGYETVEDLKTANTARIKTLLGVVGIRLVSELRGIPVFAVDNQANDQKSMVSSRSFKASTHDVSVLQDAIGYHTRRIGADLRKKELLATVIRINIQASRYSDFMLQGTSLEAVLDNPSNDTFTLLQITQKLLNKAFKSGVPYKKVGVSVSQLVSSEVRQGLLFDDKRREKQALLCNVVDSLNKKADRELITIGNRGYGVTWQARKDSLSPAYTTKWSDVAVVKA